VIAAILALLFTDDARAVTLDEVLAAAEGYAPAARSADASEARALAEVRRGRRLLGPTLTGSAAYTLYNYEVVYGGVVIQPLHFGQAAAGLVQPLSLAAIATQRASEPLADAAAREAEAVRESLTLTVVRAYYDLLVAQEAVTVQASLLELAQAQEKLATSRFAVGMTDERAALRARLSTSRAHRELEAAQTARTAASEALRALTGREEATALAWPDVPDVPAESAPQRDEIAAATERLKAAHRRARSAWTLRMPDLSAGVTAAWTENAGFTGRNEVLTGQLAATWSLPLMGANVQQRAAWRADVDLAEAELHAAEDAVAQQVATARAEWARALAAAAAMADELTLAERHHALTTRAFEVGSATALEVEEAMAEVRAARLGSLRERASVAVATFSVAWAEGRL
jgi:outer membrane protein TolC